MPSCVSINRMAGFEYATYNDVEDLKRVVKRINRRGKIRSLFGRPRRAVAAIMMEPLQVRDKYTVSLPVVLHGAGRRREKVGVREHSKPSLMFSQLLTL